MDNDFTRSTAPLGLAESWEFPLPAIPPITYSTKAYLRTGTNWAEEYRLRR